MNQPRAVIPFLLVQLIWDTKPRLHHQNISQVSPGTQEEYFTLTMTSQFMGSSMVYMFGGY